MTTNYPWPLPSGHFFGPPGFDLQSHDGRELDPAPAAALAHWQRQYARRFGDRDLVPTGLYGGPTQRAALHVQRECELRMTGNVDEETWVACLAYGRQSTSQPQDAGLLEEGRPEPTLPERVDAARREDDRARKSAANKARHAAAAADRQEWKGKSTLEHQYAQAGCPAWWPGHEFGPGSTGEHVAKIRSILGDGSRSRSYSTGLEQLVRGLQSANGLEPTGVVDLATAKIMDGKTS